MLLQSLANMNYKFPILIPYMNMFPAAPMVLRFHCSPVRDLLQPTLTWYQVNHSTRTRILRDLSM